MSWKGIAERQKERSEKSAQKGSKRGDGDLFMSTKGGGKYTVRFVGDAKEINILWYPAQGGKKHIVPQNYVERMKAVGYDVRSQMVCNVIDRDDSKLRFKLLEKGMKVYGPVLTRFNEVLDDDGNQVHPGGPGGDDWRMVVDVPEDVRNTSYEMSNLKPTKFTAEEIALLKRGRPENQEKYKDLPIGERGKIDIDKIYDAEKYIEALDKLIADKEGEMDETDSVADVTTDQDASLKAMTADLTADSGNDGSTEEDTDDDLKDILF